MDDDIFILLSLLLGCYTGQRTAACKKSIGEVANKYNKELRYVDFTDKEAYGERSLNLTEGKLK